jgi:hypothetical protein
MIYFDRIEVVNILSANSGKYLQLFVILNNYYMRTESCVLRWICLILIFKEFVRL